MAATRPYRSVLYIPGSSARALQKARGLPADAIIFDLEDAVAPDAKAEARAALRAALQENGYGKRAKLVRINALSTEWGLADARTFAAAGADAILLPKVDTAGDIDMLRDVIGPDLPIWAMMETPLSILNAREIAAHAQVAGLVAGTNDLAKDLRVRGRADRLPLMLSLQTIVLAARVARIVAVDGVYNRFKDEEGLRAECERGRDLGFDGKTLIHPKQLEAANEVFAPSAEAVEFSRRIIAAHAEAQKEGKGVVVVDGKLIENLHVENAQRLVALADAIAARA